MLVEIKNLGYDNFQFSLDSCDPEILNRHLHVQHDYINRIDEMLSSCDNLGLGIDIRTVITSINGTETRLTELYRFITRHKCIKRWDLTPYFYSPYKSSSYQEHRPNNEILRYMWNFSKREDLSIPIYLNKIGEDGYELQKYNNTEEFTENNMVCSGNCSCLSILANGICNVCEMLYEHPDFILGDAKSTPIYKIWNSDRAKKIYQLPQNEAPSNSACATCKDYNTCRLDFHKRICFSDIIKTGGSLYSPDPRCPKSKKHDFIL